MFGLSSYWDRPEGPVGTCARNEALLPVLLRAVGPWLTSRRSRSPTAARPIAPAIAVPTTGVLPHTEIDNPRGNCRGIAPGRLPERRPPISEPNSLCRRIPCAHRAVSTPTLAGAFPSNIGRGNLLIPIGVSFALLTRPLASRTCSPLYSCPCQWTRGLPPLSVPAGP